MKIVMEKYHGCGNDYLIWDPVKNKMQLDHKRVKAILKNNLGLGCAGILYGPITKDNVTVFKFFDSRGYEDAIGGEENRWIFFKYIKDAGYDPSNMISFVKSKTMSSMEYKVSNIGFIILNNEFVRELEII